MTGKCNITALMAVMLILSIACVLLVPRGVFGAEASTTFSEDIVTSNIYRTVPTYSWNLTDYYERYVGLSAVNWTCNMTFPDWAWNTAGGAFANSSSSIVANIMFSNVQMNDSNVPYWSDSDTEQTALWLKLTPYKTALDSACLWLNGTATTQVMGDSFVWDNSSISIYAVGSSITVCRNASTSGAHNDTWTITSGMSGVNVVQPKYLYYWLYTGTGGYEFNDTVSAGSIKFTFSDISDTAIMTVILSDVLPIIVTLIVVSSVLAMVTGIKIHWNDVNE